MSFGIIKLFEDAELLLDQRRFVPAIQMLEEARRLTELPDRRAWATYNIGTIYWHHLGDGLSARREFLACVGHFEKYGYGSYFTVQAAKAMHANVLENAMLCALSFEEFSSLAARLHAITPDPPILTSLVPEVRNMQERGQPWSTQLFGFARRYSDRSDPRRDTGRYGEARSTYHLILTHRQDLRLSRNDWRLALEHLCAFSLRMTSDCIIARGGDDDPHSPEEFLSILTEAIPEADQYLLQNSGDDDLKKKRAIMEEMVKVTRDKRSTVQGTSQPFGFEPARISDPDWLRWRGHWNVALAFLYLSICIFMLDFIWLMLDPVQEDAGAASGAASIFAKLLHKSTNLRVVVLQISTALAVVHSANLLVCGICKSVAERRANSNVHGLNGPRETR